MLKKTYVADTLKQIQRKNKGERNKYLYENNHIGIISQEQFDTVQEERKRRSNSEISENGKSTRKAVRYSRGNTLLGKIICGECGKNFRRITTHKGEMVWRCAGRVEKGGNCTCKTVKQSEIDDFLKSKCKDRTKTEDIYTQVGKIVVKSDGLLIETRSQL